MMQLNEKYNRNQFIEFLSFFIPGFKKDIREVDVSGLKTLQGGRYLGKNENFDLQVFELEHKVSPGSRVALASDGFRIMRDSSSFQSLVSYYSPGVDEWRLSLMMATPKINEKVKVVTILSNPRRYSYALGSRAKVNTPYNFLIKKGKVKSYDELKERFSVEVVNKEFYREIAKLYTELVGGIRENGKNKIEYPGLIKLPSILRDDTLNHEFAVRLIGRVIFCWFLREKKSDKGIPLISEDILSLRAIKKNTNYYHNILEPLFFEILNKPIKERKDKYAEGLYSLIPYLNGGLFTPNIDDFYNTNGSEKTNRVSEVIVPDKWLLSLFEVLELYNFTIDENTIIDVDLSIDPEMLGRIFENLLAEINPETGKTARKNTGSYYTPREIVNYMIDESLFNYLTLRTKINDDEIRSLISYDLNDDLDCPINDTDKPKIIRAIYNLKLLDPACGSGAFPIGALQKILYILQVIDPNGKLWLEEQIKAVPLEVRRLIQSEFSNKNLDYVRKLGIIRNCIFGVDIQPVATEISRLRCFLTLIVDEMVKDKEDNRGIEPLPNLDFKFVSGNSLISLDNIQKERQQQSLFEDTEGIKELKELRDMFFVASGYEREQLKLQFVQTQNKMLQKLVNEESKGHASLTTKLTTWEPFTNKASSWFDPEWMFGVNNGFDIVIANPPYVFTRGVKFGLNFKKYINDNYFSNIALSKKTKARQAGKINLFAVFILCGKRLLDKNGNLIFIIPNNILRGTIYDSIRYELLKNNKIISIVDLGKGIFGGVTASTILLNIGNKTKESNYRSRIITNVKSLMDKDYELKTVDQNIFLRNVSYTFNIMLNKEEIELSNKIKRGKIFFYEFCKDIIEGIVAHKHLIKKRPDINTIELYEGKDIKRYSFDQAKNFLIWDKDKIHRTRPEYLWKVNKKIVMQRISGGSMPLVAALDAKKRKTFASTNNIVLKEEFDDYYEFFTGLLNSKLMNWFYANNFSNKSDLTVNISKTFLEALPIPKISNRQESIISLVNKIIVIKESEDYLKNSGKKVQVKKYANQIDQLVYKLYDISLEELKMIEKDLD